MSVVGSLVPRGPACGPVGAADVGRAVVSAGDTNADGVADAIVGRGREHEAAPRPRGVAAPRRAGGAAIAGEAGRVPLKSNPLA
jgi:hypothetical protein